VTWWDDSVYRDMGTLVHEHGVNHKQLHYHNRFGKKLTVPVGW